MALTGFSFPQKSIRFGDCELNAPAFELRRGRRTVKLERIPLQVLLLLIEEHGKVVSREAIADHIWGKGVFVDVDNGINTAIRKIRQVLNDDRQDPRFVETIPGVGYRFIAPLETPAVPVLVVDRREVVPLANAESAADPTTKTGTTHRVWIRAAGVLLVLLVIAGIGAWLGWRHFTAQRHTIRSIAVLPLRNLSSDSEQAWFAEGMTDELITRVAELQGLRVISHTSVMRYQQTKESVPEIARELHVDAIVEGTILRDGNRVRITAQLVRGADDRHLWADSYERDLRDVLDLQNQIARDIAWNISLVVNPAVNARLIGKHPVDPNALQLYLRGRYHWRTRRLGDLNEAVSEFQQALAIDPNFAPAWAGLADCYVVLPLLDPSASEAELYPKARQAAREALAIDPDLPEVHTSVAYAKMYQDWDFAGAEAEFRKALQLGPNYATGHQWYAELLSLEGRHAEAIPEVGKAEELDPFSAVVHHEAGQIYRQARRYDLAIAEYQRSIELDPGMSVNYWWMSDAYFRTGKMHESSEALRASLSWLPAEEYARTSKAIDELQLACRDRGSRCWTTELIQIWQLAGRPSYFLALAYARLGKDARAFNYLERAYREHDSELLSIQVDPEWDRLRADPRYIALVNKIGLPSATLGAPSSRPG